MSQALSVDTTARDLTLNLHDSCNCCCWGGRRFSPMTQVYVRENGEVLVFDSRKAKDKREAMARCVSNLEHIIENMKVDTDMYKKEALNQLKKRVISSGESPPSPITLGIIEDVIKVQNNTKPVMRFL